MHNVNFRTVHWIIAILEHKRIVHERIRKFVFFSIYDRGTSKLVFFIRVFATRENSALGVYSVK